MSPAPVQDDITVLMPCKDQKKEFFFDALQSMLQQTSSRWRLLVITDPASPPDLELWTESVQDNRIELLRCPNAGFARALNYGLSAANTCFVSILLSDDRYAPNAIEVLIAYRERFPAADFFHSARRHINERGALWGDVMPTRKTFDLDYFWTRGSPVKHLLCWRREKAIDIGGMDESLSLHGCDDYDFPWRMAEAGARFQAIDECLYEYRLHHSHDRLTTSVAVQRQITTLRKMFDRHAVPARESDRFVQRAISNYLVPEFLDQIDHHRGAHCFIRCFREAKVTALVRFRAAGFKQRHFFPHRVYVLPKAGPDGMYLCERMMGIREPSALREFILYALPPVSTEIPRDVYYDDDLQWHRQQFGIDGHVACADVAVSGSCLHCYLLISDLVQRVARVPACRTRIDNRFKGWARLLVNAVLIYAAENKFQTVYSATSALVLQHTDRKRNPKPALYQRIYDSVPQEFGAELEGQWWRFDVGRLTSRVTASLDREVEVDSWPKIVCIMHDTERALGHIQSDPGLAQQMDDESRLGMPRMLDIERRLGIKTTYNLVGLLYPELHGAIAQEGHAIGFHSYDHSISGDQPETDGSEQLSRCRTVDYRVKGYRPVQSKLTRGLEDTNLSQFNFEWLASSASSLRSDDPFVMNGIVKIPVHLDDYAMFRHAVCFDEWVRQAFDLIDARDFVVIGLHDCYSRFWLDWYEEFLHAVLQKAQLWTLDEVAARVALGHAQWFETIESPHAFD